MTTALASAPFTSGVTMTSKEIAELTGKRHDNVLQDIRNLLKSLDSCDSRAGLSFEETTEPDSQGIHRPIFRLNRKAALFLVTKYDDVRRLKVINRLEEMEIAMLGYSPTTGRADAALSAEQSAQHILGARLGAAALLGVPLHISQQEAVKAVARTTGVDYLPLLQHAPAQNNIPFTEQMLEPTELAKHFGVDSPQKINKMLASIGYQVKTANGWQPTELGRAYCARHAWATSHKSGYNLKWSVAALTDALRGVVRKH